MKNQQRTNKGKSTQTSSCGQKGSSSKKQSQQQPTTKKKPNIVLTDRFIKAVNYMLSTISYTEWSGFLYYTFTGSIKDVNSMQFTLVDFLPLDIGNPAYTEFDTSKFRNEIIDMYTANPAIMHCKVGLIHSHNHMQAFFSGTDEQQLKEGITKGQFDLFLSVIVNNARDMVAKVAVQTVTKVVGKATHSITFNKESHNLVEDYVQESTSFASFECDCDEAKTTLKASKDELSCMMSCVSNLLKDKTSRSVYTPSYQLPYYSRNERDFDYSPTGYRQPATLPAAQKKEDYREAWKSINDARSQTVTKMSAKPFIVEEKNGELDVKLEDERFLYSVLMELLETTEEPSIDGLYKHLQAMNGETTAFGVSAIQDALQSRVKEPVSLQHVETYCENMSSIIEEESAINPNIALLVEEVSLMLSELYQAI